MSSKRPGAPVERVPDANLMGLMSERSTGEKATHRATACVLALFVIGCQIAPQSRPPAMALPKITAAAPIGATAVPGPLAPGFGSIAMRIHWPRRTQSIPISASLIIVSIIDPLNIEQTRFLIRRPAVDDDTISNVAIPVRAARHLTIWARAYRDDVISNDQTANVVPVAVGSATNIDIFDNSTTPVSINLLYIPISATSIEPSNGGVGAKVTLTGVGFNGFVDPLHATPSFKVLFTHQTVFEGNIPNFPIAGKSSPSAQTDLWIGVPNVDATRSSDTKVEALVPKGAVTGPIDYQVDGLSAAASPKLTFTVLKDLVLVKGSGADLSEVTRLAVLTGTTQAFSAVATDSLGSAFNNPTVTWSSSDQAIGVIGTSGSFRARQVGRTRISAKTGDLIATADVFVFNPQSSASFNVPLPAVGSTASVNFNFPDYEGGTLVGTGSP